MAQDIYKDLKNLLALPKTLNKILFNLTVITKKIEKLEQKVEKTQKGLSKRMAIAERATLKKKAGRPRKAQTPLADVIVQVMQKNKGPVSINDLADAIIKGKLFVSKSKNFKNNLRVVLYKNEKGLFKKVSKGKFELAGEKKKPVERKAAKKKPAKKVAKTKVKKSAKQKKKAKSSKKVTPVKLKKAAKVPAKKKTAKASKKPTLSKVKKPVKVESEPPPSSAPVEGPTIP